MIVVDTNILAYRWLPSPQGRLVDALITIDAEWAAPLLWRSEFRNLLAGMMRSGRMTLAEAEASLHKAADCLIAGEHAVADHAVLELVGQTRCTAYDCEFAALAKALGTVLVTEDKALLAAFPKFCRSLSYMLGD